MKNIFKIAALFLFLGTFTACVQDDDYSTPVILANEPDVTETNTFKQIKDMYAGDVVNFSDGLVISGYVVSSDESGNFYKSIAIQNDVDGMDDDASNPRLGLKLLIDASDLFERFNVGRKVYIRLDGLAMNESRDGSGDFEIGLYDETEFNELTEIPEYILNGYSFGDVDYAPAVERSLVTETIMPKVMNVSDFTDADVNTLVQLEGIQSSNIGDTFAGLPSDQYDAERTLFSCADNSTVTLATSTFANFKDLGIPTGKGTATAVLNVNFDGNAYILKVNNASDLDFTENRCDPIFEENFESYSYGDSITQNGWTDYKEVGSKDFFAFDDSYSLGTSVKISAYNSGDASNIAWLITPGIDMDAQTGEVLSFQTSNSFSDNSTLELLISTDWDGVEANITSATWSALPGTIVADSEFYQNWVGSGAIDLSGYAGTAYIAFRYTGGDNGTSQTGTYELDEFKIFAD